MAYHWEDDFEDGDLASYSNLTSAVTNSTLAAHSGTRGMRQAADGTNAGIAALSDATLPDGYVYGLVSCWFRQVAHTSGNSSVITIQNRTGSDHLDIFVNYGADSKFWWDINSANNAQSAATVTLNQWYRIQTLVYYGATTWTARVWLDGVEQTSIATSGKTASDVRAVFFGGFGTDVNTRDFDDVQVDLTDTNPLLGPPRPRLAPQTRALLVR